MVAWMPSLTDFLSSLPHLFFFLEKEREWKGPFYFIQGADPQFGLMKAWSTGDCDSGGDEWEQEIHLTKHAVEAINKLNPKPKFFVLCGDLIHAMPGKSCVVMGDLFFFS